MHLKACMFCDIFGFFHFYAAPGFEHLICHIYACHIGKNHLLLWELFTHFSPVLHFVKKPVISFAPKNKRLVSICNARLGGNTTSYVVFCKEVSSLLLLHFCFFCLLNLSINFRTFFYSLRHIPNLWKIFEVGISIFKLSITILD